MKRLTLIPAILALGAALAACGDSQEDANAGGTVPVITMPFIKYDSPIAGDNSLTVECPNGGSYGVAAPDDGLRVVTLETEYQLHEFSDGEISIPVPDAEMSVVQIIPNGGECMVRGEQPPAALGEYTITERTVFAISVRDR